MFNLAKDSLERYDISDKNPKIIAELEEEYKKWDAKNLAPGWFDPHAENVLKEEKKFEQEREKSRRH